jgi:hypothetical protein
MGRYPETLLSYDQVGLPALSSLLSICLLYVAFVYVISLLTCIFVLL